MGSGCGAYRPWPIGTVTPRAKAIELMAIELMAIELMAGSEKKKNMRDLFFSCALPVDIGTGFPYL